MPLHRTVPLRLSQRPKPAQRSLSCRAEAALPDVRQLKIESRVLHLPMAFRESKSKDAMQRYASSVRPEAVYLPDNVPFVAANNGLGGGVDALKKIVFDASYMVFGLGDVYLGAPCAVPINPLHRCALLSCPHRRGARRHDYDSARSTTLGQPAAARALCTG